MAQDEITPAARPMLPPVPKPEEPILTLAALADELRAKVTVQTLMMRGGRTATVPVTAEAGSPDEIWLKLLEIRYSHQRHTRSEWKALIDKLRDEPAHPTDPRYGS
jgi:hypothetical protein